MPLFVFPAYGVLFCRWKKNFVVHSKTTANEASQGVGFIVGRMCHKQLASEHKIVHPICSCCCRLCCRLCCFRADGWGEKKLGDKGGTQEHEGNKNRCFLGVGCVQVDGGLVPELSWLSQGKVIILLSCSIVFPICSFNFFPRVKGEARVMSVSGGVWV